MPTLDLTPDEARVLGVLIEKERTTPESYPLTLNALVNGANQKNNRHPITNIDDQQAMSAVIGLRNKGLVVQQDGPGQRVPKFRHQFKEKTACNTPEMVILAELMLRGPQTLGELRGHASRMHPLESLDMVRTVLQQLMARAPEPMVMQIRPAPGSRAERYVQTLCPDLHPIADDATAAGVGAVMPQSPETTGPAGAPSLSQRITQLEDEVQTLRDALERLATQLGAVEILQHAGAQRRERSDRPAASASAAAPDSAPSRIP
jgi:uncharacterized protein YceH (UPF0502 family)